MSRRALAIVTVLFSTVPAAQAVQTFCVGGPSGLQTVLETIVDTWPEYQTNIPERTIIKLQTGTYAGVQIPATGLQCDPHPYLPGVCYNPRIAGFGSIDIIGGYGTSCATRTEDASLTVLEPIASSDFSLVTHGDLLLQNLTFEGFGSNDLSFQAVESKLEIERVQFLDNAGIELRAKVDSSIRLEGSVIAAAHGASGDALTVELSGGVADITFNTITGNEGSGLRLLTNTCSPNPLNNYCSGQSTGGSGIARLVNNIIWGHPFSVENPGRRDIWNGRLVGETVHDDVGSLYLLNNLFTTLGGGPTAVEAESINANPEFIFGSYNLSAASPARDVATEWLPTGVPSVDTNGDPRPTGSGYDLGARERQAGPLAVATVTTTANSGGGSLRQALIDANANADLTVIRFNIAGSCTNNLISPSTLLPDVTTPIILDGYTQPGSERNTVGLGDNDGTICVGLSGSDTLEWGLRTPPGDSDARLEVYGLAFRRFTDAAIKLESGKVHVIRGNRFSIGLGAAGSTVISGASRRHIVLLSGATRSVIGGADPGDRNYFALAEDEAILLSASTLTTADIGQHVVLNNYIGSNLDGDNDFGNGIGIRVSGRDNFIEDNLVSGNLGDGILVQGSEANGNRIAGNTIGLKRTTLLGTFDLPNLGSGVRIAEGDNNDVVNNRIAHNGLDGITVIEGNGNTIRGGSIYSNVGQGVDLGDDGADTNNNDGAIQPVGSPNWFRNYPVLAQALHAESVLRVVGSLESVESTFTIDLFSQGASTCDELSNGHVNGEARTYEGSFVVTIENAPFGQNGRVDFDVTLAASRADFTGQTVTAIATDASGNSSELSACTPLTAWILFADGFESGDTSAWN